MCNLLGLVCATLSLVSHRSRHGKASLVGSMVGVLTFGGAAIAFFVNLDTLRISHGWGYVLIAVALLAALVSVTLMRMTRGLKRLAWAASFLAAASLTVWLAASHLAAPPAITASVQHNVDSCSSLLVPGGVSNLNPPANDSIAAWSSFARNSGAIDVNPWSATQGSTFVTVTLKGASGDPIRIDGLQIHVLSRKAMPSGDYVSGQCGDPVQARYAEFNLDETPAKMVRSSGMVAYLGDKNATPLRFPYEISDSKLETLLIMGDASEFVSWTAELQWSDGRQSGSIVIDDDGQPFLTGHTENTTMYMPSGAKWEKVGS